MNCLFCKIINQEIPAEIVFEDEDMIAFKDIHPVAPLHVLFIPKRHISSLSEIRKDEENLIGKMFHKISLFANEQGMDKNGYRVVNNTGSDGGQTVFHIHFHLLAGRAFSWPPG